MGMGKSRNGRGRDHRFHELSFLLIDHIIASFFDLNLQIFLYLSEPMNFMSKFESGMIEIIQTFLEKLILLFTLRIEDRIRVDIVLNFLEGRIDLF